MADRPDLVIEAARLARNAPEEWKHFLNALAAHTEVSRNNCVTSPVAELQVNQGKAQALTDLCERLDNCIVKADRAIQRKETKL